MEGMSSNRRPVLIWRWSILAFITVGLFWIIYWLANGEIPADFGTEGCMLTAWFAGITVAINIFLFTSKIVYEKKFLLPILVFVLIAIGMGSGLFFGLNFRLSLGLAYGLVAVIISGLAAALINALIVAIVLLCSSSLLSRLAHLGRCFARFMMVSDK